MATINISKKSFKNIRIGCLIMGIPELHDVGGGRLRHYIQTSVDTLPVCIRPISSSLHFWDDYNLPNINKLIIYTELL